MNNLQFFRELINVKPKTIALLLNVTVHTYIAYEQERMHPSQEIVKMLSMLYGVDDLVILGLNSFDEMLVLRLKKMSYMTDEDKYRFLASRILGNGVKLTSKNIREKKNSIKNCLLEKNNKQKQ